LLEGIHIWTPQDPVLLAFIDAQRSLFQTEDQLAKILTPRLQASFGLFKARGGAWEMQ